MSDAPRIVARPAHGTTPTAELDALSAIYRRAIARYEEKQRGGPETVPEDCTLTLYQKASGMLSPTSTASSSSGRQGKNTAGVSSTDNAKEIKDGHEERKQKEKHVS